MEIAVTFTDLLMATVPLWAAIFAGAWALVKQLVFNPLNAIATDVKDIKESFSHLEEKTSLLELKVKHIEDKCNECVGRK